MELVTIALIALIGYFMYDIITHRKRSAAARVVWREK